ncbi:MAG TPA: sterol desaturase family protein [Dyella sp.]|uniref:sterol desaturase family protein n=1 Tax=Dyella sp. TaxID=1869338 RepID=UPI002CC1FF4E|nr:sterol desaturase family protein [Dyella sp.]HTV86733.1 sterol desaturase family protein [Dyella sp.]
MEHMGRSPVFLGVMAVCILLEWFWRRRIARVGYDGGNAWTSLVIGVGNLLAGALAGLVLGRLYAGAAALAPVHWPMHSAWTWLAAFVLVEFCYYWFHRASHRVRWMWANHAVHHTPEEMTLLSAVRLGWTHLLSFGWLFYLPLVLAGFDPRMVLALLVADLHYQFFLHTEAIGRLGPLEWVLNTPAHHRVHHASNDAYLDGNYGGVLIIFDRMFGTLRTLRDDEPIRYGLAHPLGTLQPLAVALGEWRRLLLAMRATASLRGALKLALGRP